MSDLRISYVVLSIVIVMLPGFANAMPGDSNEVLAKPNQEARWHTKARIIKLNRQERKLLLAHQDIPGLMPAMTMAFSIGELPSDSTKLSQLRENDTIAIDFSKSKGAFTIHHIALLSRSRVINTAVHPEILWDHLLVDQHQNRVTLRDFRKKVLLVNFFYSHCPTVCPMQTANLVKLNHHLADNEVGGIHFISISLDPARDTPTRLLEFANKFLIFEREDPANWSFLTGDYTTVKQVTNGFNAIAIKQSNGEFEHWVGLYLVDRSGNVAATYHGENFDPEQVIGDIKGLL